MWRNIYHANRGQKKARVAILISDKLDFKTKTSRRDKEGHSITIKGTIQQEDLTIVNIYAPNMGAANYINQLITKLNKHINNNKIVGILRPHSWQWTDHLHRRSTRKQRL